MARRHHYRRRQAAPTELDMTTFMNLMVVLVPFLLITAVFSRITVVELTLPSTSGGAAKAAPEFRLEVIVRDTGLELSNGEAVIAALPKIDGKYDLATLGEMVMTLKQDYPDSRAASVLLEPRIEYDHLIQIMDVVRSAPLPEGARTVPVKTNAEEGTPRVALFTDISIGDAP
jgi:biopolymer transport protein ExbD